VAGERGAADAEREMSAALRSNSIPKKAIGMSSVTTPQSSLFGIP
jgi:hypothetical protein